MASLFDLDARVFPTLLNNLITGNTAQSDINVESVFLVLRTGKVQGLCRIEATEDFATEKPSDGQITQVLVPASLLKDCILAAASELQISALSLVIESKTPAAPLTSAEFDILRTFFPYSLTITNPAARGELRGFFVKLLTRLRASTYALARDMARSLASTRPNDTRKKKKSSLRCNNLSMQAATSWNGWFDSSAQPFTQEHRIKPASRRSPSSISSWKVEPIQGSPTTPQKDGTKTLTKNAGMSLNKSKQVFSQEFPFSIDLITPSLVKLLLACSESTYDDIQIRALTMLARFPAPLAGLETEEAAAKRILGRAAVLLTSTRDFESAAASRLLQLYRQIYMSQLGHKPASLLSFVGQASSASTRACNHPTLTLIFDLFSFLDYQIRSRRRIRSSMRQLRTLCMEPS